MIEKGRWWNAIYAKDEIIWGNFLSKNKFVMNDIS